ncbi:hypothetical protein [Sphaerospermopsis sp. FACHB-1194]|nr:hypothetical protein [Sphaerospermopsis sp. FACHB-1194]
MFHRVTSGGRRQRSREQGAGEQGEIICIFPITNPQSPVTISDIS